MNRHVEIWPNSSEIPLSRFRYLARKVHLCPRPLYELLCELADGADRRRVLEHYAALEPLAEFITCIDGDQMPPAARTRCGAAMMDLQIEPVARALLGTPNRRLSKQMELRYGNNGSLKVDLKKNAWFDHEARRGGGVLDLVRHRVGVQTDTEAFRWLEREHLLGNTKNNDGKSFDGSKRSAANPVTVASFEYLNQFGDLALVVERREFQFADGTGAPFAAGEGEPFGSRMAPVVEAPGETQHCRSPAEEVRGVAHAVGSAIAVDGIDVRGRGFVVRPARGRDVSREHRASSGQVEAVGAGGARGVFCGERRVAVLECEVRLPLPVGGERGGHEHDWVAGMLLDARSMARTGATGSCSL